jgi:hypothetical protein
MSKQSGPAGALVPRSAPGPERGFDTSFYRGDARHLGAGSGRIRSKCPSPHLPTLVSSIKYHLPDGLNFEPISCRALVPSLWASNF